MENPQNNLKVAYFYDEDGFYAGETMWQLLNGAFVPCPMSTDVAPWGDGELDPTLFYRYDEKTEQWSTEKKPQSAEDFLGIVVSHTSMTPHDIEMRELCKKFAQTDGYREVRSEDLAWSIEKIPEPTPEEKLAQAEEGVRAKRDSLIRETDFLLMADYPISEEDRKQVEEYRQKLRDIPAKEGFPYDVAFPDKPEIVKKMTA